jgi:hypothetical protein
MVPPAALLFHRASFDRRASCWHRDRNASRQLSTTGTSVTTRVAPERGLSELLIRCGKKLEGGHGVARNATD